MRVFAWWSRGGGCEYEGEGACYCFVFSCGKHGIKVGMRVQFRGMLLGKIFKNKESLGVLFFAILP